jgi:hypothetical protein
LSAVAHGPKVRTYNKYLGIPPSNVDEDDIERDPDIEEGPDSAAIRRKRKAGGLAAGSLPASRQDRPSRARRGGRITAAARQKLPSSDFALPGKGAGPKGAGPGSYPIDTPNRARNALARGAQHASPAEQATIKRKVKAKYPSIDVGQD